MTFAFFVKTSSFQQVPLDKGAPGTQGNGRGLRSPRQNNCQKDVMGVCCNSLQRITATKAILSFARESTLEAILMSKVEHHGNIPRSRTPIPRPAGEFVHLTDTNWGSI